MHVADLPRFVPAETYERVLSEITRNILNQPGALAVYQVGSVSTPGISDLDLCAIFADGAAVRLDPRAGLDNDARYIVTHGQFGLSQSHYRAAAPYGFFHNFQLLGGTDLPAVGEPLTAEALSSVRTQEGLEYLVKMWIWLAVAERYGVLRLRSLMLLVKGLLYDLSYLGTEQGALVDAIHQMLEWRQDWFRNRPSRRELAAWVAGFQTLLERQLEGFLEDRRLYIPAWARLRIAPNMTLENGARLSMIHRGLSLPALFAGYSRKTFNLQHRLNRFRFQVPMTAAGMPPGVAERHRLINTMVNYNRVKLPHFTPVTYGLSIYGSRDARP